MQQQWQQQQQQTLGRPMMGSSARVQKVKTKNGQIVYRKTALRGFEPFIKKQYDLLQQTNRRLERYTKAKISKSVKQQLEKHLPVLQYLQTLPKDKADAYIEKWNRQNAGELKNRIDRIEQTIRKSTNIIPKPLGFNPRSSAPPSFLMEYLEGYMSLAEVLGSLTRSCRREIAQKILNAISLLHKIGIVHNDIKPGNIIVNPQNCEVRLIDFNSAKINDGRKYPSESTEIYTSPRFLVNQKKNIPNSYSFQELVENDWWATYLVVEQIIRNQPDPVYLRDIEAPSFLGLIRKLVQKYSEKDMDEWMADLRARLQ